MKKIEPSDFTFPVYIHEKVLKQIKKICKKTKLEVFGYLIGTIQKWNKQFYIIIEEQLFIIGAIHSDKYSFSQIEGTAGMYEKKFQKLKKSRKKDDLRIVGWFHSHPGFGAFLSTTDVHTQEAFFYESYQVALVIDPIKNELGFFTLDGKLKEKYKEISYAIIES
jgi:proteasome lid subunit RPN8/RPN11